jgi:PAS domain S-box-containing protein
MVLIHFDAAWACLFAVALGWGLAAGAAWEREKTSGLAAENRQLREVAERHRDELCEAQKLSSHLQSEASLALRDSEALYHSLVDHLPLSVLRKDRDGRYTFVSRRYLEFSGKESHEILGTTDFDLFPHELATKYRQGDEQVLSTGAQFEDVEAYRKPDGEIRNIQVLKTPVRDAQKRVIGTQVMFWDVTESKSAEKALRESEERARLIVETAYDPFVSIDAGGRVLDWNTQATSTFGWTREDVLGKTLADLIVPAKYREAHRGGIGRYLETGVGPLLNSRIEITALHRDGHEFPVELIIWPVRTSKGCCFNAFVHDITRRKAAEAEIRSKNQDLETLLYVTSHDLREPLRAIENFSRIVCERYADKLDAKGRDFLERVVRGAQRLDRLLEDVLTLSRVQRTVEACEDVDSGEIVADVLRHLETRIRETQAVVQVIDGLPYIRADRRWATQAVQNLVSNALKYTVEGRAPEVEIGGFQGPEGVGLIVRDRGMGVPADYAERIFQLFQRAVSRNIEGTGAGLAIVKRVAERHGGRAWVRPRDGGGSEFIITFGSGTAA